MASSKPKFFRIATEGATSDGRVIDRQMLLQMAASYTPQTYGARINLEHIRGIDPKGMFQAYGDVLALKAEEQDGKMRLFAQLDPTPELVSLTKARQKIFCSMEVNPDFADTGEAYLTGLAVTDNPASLGCEMLQFSAKAKVNPLADRKQDPNNLFSEAVEVELDFTADDPSEPAQPTNGLAASIKRLFGCVDKSEAGSQAQHADTREAVEQLAREIHAMGGTFTKVTQALESIASRVDTIQSEQQKDKAEFSTLKTALDSTESYSRRPPATGGNGSTAASTDC
ncbi:Phage capsid scaffolding protein (GPO) serine peptidase [Ralstonia sp. 25mfcol4.1]|uniref:GPO family capsid scaffolding protein n=1 Tax=Burkholderiaceae TaxID=119060 RepID=UPI00088CF075|nr:GPO family capsid scaffolding protein [Ralstonia sp. 25mfcol4.1]SDO93824.1 Phage capsid scaffolding protein (GPO) serine peptidase [Ralstonia sp. 25mfcol4.1]